jgi:putative transposase
VNWDIRESMTEADIEIILQRAREKYPEARPRIISDNGPQFIAKDCKEFIRMLGDDALRTSPFYPQSNGKIERWHKSLEGGASGREHHCRSMMRGDWCRVTSSVTTTSV